VTRVPFQRMVLRRWMTRVRCERVLPRLAVLRFHVEMVCVFFIMMFLEQTRLRQGSEEGWIVRDATSHHMLDGVFSGNPF
jgi:hypothetical protein